jgi:hypothetical protein
MSCTGVKCVADVHLLCHVQELSVELMFICYVMYCTGVKCGADVHLLCHVQELSVELMFICYVMYRS